MKITDDQLKDYLTGWRRKFHANPELSFTEVMTSQAIAGELKRLGCQVKTGVNKTGVVGIIAGKGQAKNVALRADMDALPIQEQNDVPYRSQNPGKMHACGHDAHCAMLLGAAWLLNQSRDSLNGGVVLLFQPSEETLPGGALGMIAEGVLENPQVGAIFGQHMEPTLRTGKVGLRPGPLMAAADNFTITVKGKGGHAAKPQECRDPIVNGAQITAALQTIVSRRVDPVQPAVVTVGQFNAGTKPNIIPDTAVLVGTARSLDKHTYKMMPEWIKQIAQGTARSGGLTASVEYDRGYPVLENDPKMIDFAEQVVKHLLGSGAAVRLQYPNMGAEDFAYYLQKVPGAFLRLGSCKDKDTGNPLHDANFNLDEDVMPKGSRLLAGLASAYLDS